jgi:soluble lytic murein transglycosylase
VLVHVSGRCLLLVAIAALASSGAIAAARQDRASAQKQDHATARKQDRASAPKKEKASADASHAKHHAAPKGQRSTQRTKHERPAVSASPRIPLPSPRPALATLPPDFAATQQAIDLVRRGKLRDATAIEQSIGDATAKKLVEWFLLRRGDSEAGFERYAAFIRTNPEWPSMSLLKAA